MSWFLLCMSFLKHLGSVGPSSFDRNTFEWGVSCHGSLKSLHVCMFSLSPQSLAPVFYYYCFSVWKHSTEISPAYPLQHIKQSLVPTTVSFVFPLWLSRLSAGKKKNKHRFKGEKQKEEKGLFHIAILNYSNFLASRLIFLFTIPYFLSLSTPTLHRLDNKHDDTWRDGGFASSLDQVQALFIFHFWTIMMITLV